MAKERRICSIEECNETHLAKGYCRKHYQQFHTPAHKKLCSIDACEEPHSCKGLCKKHYMDKYNEEHYEELQQKKKKRYEDKRDGIYQKDPLNYCSVSGCNERVQALGLCRRHYNGIVRSEQRKEYRDGHKEEAKEYSKIYRAEHREELAEAKKGDHKKSQARFSQAKNKAKKRQIEFTLTREEYYSIANLPCYYCNYELGQQSVGGTGLDRLDSNLGYTLKNSVSCCKICNAIKWYDATPEETKFVVQRLLDYRKRKISG